MSNKFRSVALATAALLAVGAVALAAHETKADDAKATLKVAARRITESQYRHTIRDAFGADIVINARFEPEKRENGLLAVGARDLSITTGGFEQYYALARSVSDQVMDPKRRDVLVGCKPADAKKADEACARAFIEKYGEILFRRPLTAAEVSARLAPASKGAEQAQDFYAGLKLALTSLLVAPDYMFRIEIAEPDPAKPTQYRLDGFTKAERLSYLFWDTGPDAELLAAAKSGEIHTDAGLQKQLARLSASPKMADGARAFFADMLQMDALDGLSKDAAIYPKFSNAVLDSAKEQTLKTVVDQLVAKKGDYRDLFTSNETFLNRPLAAVYNVPYASAADWAAYSFPKDAERAGIMTQVSFLAAFSHPGASSPTKRGVKVHEIFMCEPMPDPPADVDFSKVQALDKGTVRARLTSHMLNDGCASCHTVSDPPGLALEHFDGLGQLRTLENGAKIDVSADLDGKKISGAPGLGRMLHDDPRVPACLVRNVYSYGVGRPTDERDDEFLAAEAKAFAKSGYRLADLMVQIGQSPEFLKVVVPAGAKPAAAPPAKVAQSAAPSSKGDVR